MYSCPFIVVHAQCSGVEIKYDLYSPVMLKIDVLKLEKRLDDELLYLRDAPPEYSTIPFNFEYDSPSSTETVPVNSVKVCISVN